jgi:hypothetical protein
MNTLRLLAWLALAACAGVALAADPGPLAQEPNTWVKRSPVKDGPASPGMGYETSLGYDPLARLLIRWGGHNQGGGGEQNAETWIFDLTNGRWTLKEPNTSPPGVCCAQQNVFDAEHNRFLRFPAFSGNHGWQWYRELALNNSAVWSYDLAKNTWRDLRPAPAPRVSPLRCADWDSDCQVVVIFGGEGSDEGTLVYDPYVNTWTRMRPKPQPAGRSGGNLAYDSAHKLHVLFGTQFNDDPHTWIYDLRKNEWRDMKPDAQDAQDAQPPTDRNDAVLAYDGNGRVVVALVRVIDKEEKDEIVAGHLETWAYDAGGNKWTRMKPPREPDGKGNRRRVLAAVPDQNLIVLEDYINPAERVADVEREQQIWTYRYAETKGETPLAPPTGVKVTTSADTATVSWQPSRSPGVEAYRVYRGEGTEPWLVTMKAVGRAEGTATSYRDTDLKRGMCYFYAVRAVGKEGKEGTDSLKVRTQPRIVEDAVVSVASPKEVRLSWTAPPGEDVVGYNVERAPVEVYSEDQILRMKKETTPLAEPSVGAVKAIGAFARLNKEVVKGTTFTDTALDLSRPQSVEGEPLFAARFRPDQLDAKGKPYRFGVFAYRVRAVNALGVEGGPSPFFLTIPAAPMGLFAKEDGEQAKLKWSANAEKELKGYRVYRMEGPRVNGPGQPVTRLNADPVAEVAYTDAKAGKDTRRYWVVAVDALGQEGFPSAPVWHYREYRRYYGPFAGEWHQ